MQEIPAVERTLLGAVALEVDRGAIRCPLGLPAVACTRGSRGGDLVRSQAAHGAAIVLMVPAFGCLPSGDPPTDLEWRTDGQVRCSEAAVHQRPLMAGTSQSGVQVGCRKPVIQRGRAGKILSGSPGAGYGRERESEQAPGS